MMRANALPRLTLTGAPEMARMARPRLGPPSDAAVGLLIVSLVPAVFWMALICALAASAGASVPCNVLLSIGAAIAAFLGMVGGALISQRS